MTAEAVPEEKDAVPGKPVAVAPELTDGVDCVVDDLFAIRQIPDPQAGAVDQRAFVVAQTRDPQRTEPPRDIAQRLVSLTRGKDREAFASVDQRFFGLANIEIQPVDTALIPHQNVYKSS